MLKDVRIQNYRLFEDLQVNGLGRVNLIVGKNNAGKTSLLEALYLLSGQGDLIHLLHVLRFRHQLFSDANADKNYYDVLSLFNEKSELNSVVIEINSAELPKPFTAKLKLNGNQLMVNGEKGETVELENGQVDSFTLRRLSNLSSKRKNGLDNQIIFLPTNGFSYKFLAELWDKTQLTPQEDAVVNMLKIIDSKVNRVGFPSRISPLPVIQIKVGDKLKPLSSLGDGMSRILTIGLALANSANHALFIDEIDTGLHYRMMTKMWEIVLQTAQELNIQVFATTHSWDCIKAFSEALEKQKAGDSNLGRLIRLQQYKNGEIEAINYTPDKLAFNVFQEIEVR